MSPYKRSGILGPHRWTVNRGRSNSGPYFHPFFIYSEALSAWFKARSMSSAVAFFGSATSSFSI